MHFTTATAIASGLVLARAVAAQSYPPFDKDSVSESLKTFWCQQQVAACPLICNDLEQTTLINECYPENLYYQCICGDNKEPDLQVYSQTIPYFTCMNVVEGCVDQCEGNGICGQQCRENKPCGAQGDPLANKTKTDNKSASTKTQSSLPTETDEDDFQAGLGTNPTETSKPEDSGASSMLSLKSSYGLATVILGLGAGFTIFL